MRKALNHGLGPVACEAARSSGAARSTGAPCRGGVHPEVLELARRWCCAESDRCRRQSLGPVVEVSKHRIAWGVVEVHGVSSAERAPRAISSRSHNHYTKLHISWELSSPESRATRGRGRKLDRPLQVGRAGLLALEHLRSGAEVVAAPTYAAKSSSAESSTSIAGYVRRRGRARAS